MVADLERQVKKEKVRNRYLQEKIKELTEKKLTGLTNEIERLNKMLLSLEVELEEEKHFNNQFTQKKEVQISEENHLTFYSYFNYSILLPPENETQVTIISDLYIVNTGFTTIEDLILCIKVKPYAKVNLSGKISNPKLLQQNDPENSEVDWVYASNDWRVRIRKEGEYWIRSSKTPNLQKNSTLVFKGFEIAFDKVAAKGRISVDAYIYGSNLSGGTSAENKIILQL
jgi:hypothetical protein